MKSPYSLLKQPDQLAAIDLNLLWNMGIRGIILDLDNTVVSEDDRYLSPDAEEWLKDAKIQGFKLIILSNGKRKYRVKYWSQRLEIYAISPARKPFSKSFCEAMAHMQLTSNQVVVIGDSRHTDVLGAWLVGCPWIQVASLPHPPRWWEWLFGHWTHRPYPTHLELYEIEPFSIQYSI